MIREEFDRTLSELLRRRPFATFVVELNDGNRIEISKPGAIATRDGSVVYFNRRQYARFNFAEVKQLIGNVVAKTSPQ